MVRGREGGKVRWWRESRRRRRKRRRGRDKWSKGETIGQKKKWWWWIHWKVFWPRRGCQIEWPVRMCEGITTDNAGEMKIVLLLLLGSRRTTRGIYKPTRWDPRRGRENWPKVGLIFSPILIELTHWLQTPGSVDVHCVLVICHILKRGYDYSLFKNNFSAVNMSRFGRSVSFPCVLRSWLRWFQCQQKRKRKVFMCDEKRRWCFSWLHSDKRNR